MGTTSARTLESAAVSGRMVAAGAGETSIFLRPPYTFRGVDHLLTNFHLPKSTLSCWSRRSRDTTSRWRRTGTAVAEGYRFYSYGDAMVIV